MNKRFMMAACAVGALLGGQAVAADWSDTFIGYRYGTQFEDPGIPKKIKKNILQLNHVSGYKYGQNFFNLDVLQSNKADPVQSGARGATEFYLVYRHQFNLNAILDKDLSAGPIRGYGFTVGFDAGTENNEVSPQKRFIVAGPTINFKVPNNGFADLSIMAGKEWNQCGLPAPMCIDKKVSFKPQLVLSGAWMVPFNAAATNWKFQGLANWASAKGDGYARVGTRAEFLLRTSVMADVGELAGLGKNKVWVGAGYEYWRNKYGERHIGNGAYMPGTKSSVPMIQAEFHF